MDDKRTWDERRRPGRPRNATPKGKPRSVLLETSVDDAICRLSLRYGISVHALLKLAATLLVKDGDGMLEKHQKL